MHVFARKGYHGATLDEIARQAGYTAPALYRYFQSKEDLFAAAMGTVTGKILEIFDEPVPDSVNFRDRLQWFVARMFRLADEHRSYFKVFARHLEPLDETRQEIAKLYAEFGRRITTLMELGIAEGALQAADVGELGAAFMGLLDGVARRWFNVPDAGPLANRAEAVVELFFHGAGVPSTNS